MPKQALINPSLIRLYQEIKKEQSKGLWLSVLASATTVLSSASLMACSSYIISFAALRPSIADIMIPVTAVRFFGISRAVLRYGERLISHHTVFGYLSQLRVWLYQSYTKLSGEDLLSLNRTDALQTLTADIETLQDFFLRALLPLLSSTFIGLFIFAVLLVKLPSFALIFLVLYLMATFGMAYVAWQLTKGHSAAQVQQLGKFKLAFTDYSEGLNELKWNNRLPDYKNKLTDHASTLEQTSSRVALGKIIATNGQQALIYLTVFSALVFGVLMVNAGEMNGIFLAVVTLVMFSFYEAAPAFLTLLQKSESSAYSAERMVSVNADHPSNQGLVLTQVPTENAHLSLEYRQLSFTYSTSLAPMHTDHLRLNANEKIAIVGPSGSGKSTLAAMLIGLLAPHSGHVTLHKPIHGPADGTPLDGSENNLMSYFSVVNQDVYLFHKRLKENLLLGNFNATEQDLEQALTLAGLKHWIGTDWYNENPWIGQNGQELSGGQKQRLALARALLRKTPFLLLDEAFAGLDLETETEVLGNLLNLKDRGLIWITHRLVKMDQMDCIYVVDQGKILDFGTHDELKNRCDLYAKMLK